MRNRIMEQPHLISSVSCFLQRTHTARGRELCSAWFAWEVCTVSSLQAIMRDQESAWTQCVCWSLESHSWLAALGLASFPSSSFLGSGKEMTVTRVLFCSWHPHVGGHFPNSQPVIWDTKHFSLEINNGHKWSDNREAKAQQMLSIHSFYFSLSGLSR